ncbi:MAG: hypothetical protein ABR521_11305 [Gaiellaceae bacterium]
MHRPGPGDRSGDRTALNSEPVSTYERIAELPLEVEGYDLEGFERPVSSAFVRRTTLVRLRGAGETGTGEDVTYDGAEHERLQAAGPILPLAGSHTIDTFSRLLEGLRLPGGPYGRWAYEGAALDLALRQARTSLERALDLEARPVRFVVSRRLGEPPSTASLHRLLALVPGLRFKLDPTSSWDEPLVAELAALGVVEAVDLKGMYRGTPVDQRPDAELYALVARAFPDAWIEDPNLTDPATAGALDAHRDRIAWDEPIHSVADIEALPSEPGAINVKPSRFGSLRALLETYAYCEQRVISVYGGGQFELGKGRGQIQHLASIFHPGAPNDVAPGGFNLPEPPPGLPGSPLEPPAHVAGFGWDD